MKGTTAERTGGPLFSVVIPVYNAAAFLETTLRSVYAQTCDDFEIIAVNDGSRDASLEILRAQTDTRLRVIDQDNGGECVARNRGIMEARGRYIAFLDSDDVWRADHLELAAQFFALRPDIAWYSTRYERVFEMPEDAMQRSSGPGEPEFMLVDWFLEGDAWTSASSAVVRREALPCRELFPAGVRMFGDCIGWCRMASQYPQMGVCSRRTALYRQLPTSACSQYVSQFHTVRTLESTGVRTVLEEMARMSRQPGCSPEAREFFRNYAILRWDTHITVNMYQELKAEMQELGMLLPPLTRLLMRLYISLQIAAAHYSHKIFFKIYRLRLNRLEKRARQRRVPIGRGDA